MGIPLCLNKLGPYINCKQTPAGICALIFMRCDAPVEFCAAPAAHCFFKYVDNINAGLNSNNSESFPVYRCFSDVTSYNNYTLTIEDFNLNSNYNSDFYTFLSQNYQFYKIGWLTSDGLLYGFYNMTLNHTIDISNDSKNLGFRKIIISFLNGRNSISIVPYDDLWLDYIKADQNWDCNIYDAVTTEIISCFEPPEPIFYNVEVTLDCPEGTTGTPVTIIAGTYASNTQLNANNLAYDAANALLDCDPATDFTFATNDPPNNVYFSALGLDSMPYPSQVSQGNHVSQLVPLTLPTLYRAGTNGYFGNTNIFRNGIFVATSINGAYSAAFLVTPGDLIVVGNATP